MESEEDRALREELDNLYWRGIYTAIQILLSKTPEQRNDFLSSLGALSFVELKRELKDFYEWKFAGKPLV